LGLKLEKKLKEQSKDDGGDCGEMFNVLLLPPGSVCNVGRYFSSECIFLVACRFVECIKFSEDSTDTRCTDDGSKLRQSNDLSQIFLLTNDALGYIAVPT
jgi:hypothetical protein